MLHHRYDFIASGDAELPGHAHQIAEMLSVAEPFIMAVGEVLELVMDSHGFMIRDFLLKSMHMTLKRHSILGVSVDDITMDEGLISAETMLKEPRAHMIATLNPEILLEASRDKGYAAILNGADLALPDGIGLVWTARALGMPFRARVAGADFMLCLCALAVREGKSVFLLGGQNGAADRTAQILRQKFPPLHIAGYSEDAEMWRGTPALFEAGIIFVALGAPKQERWIAAARSHLPEARILMGVGGAFDMISGVTPRAPLFFQKTGFEWLWRFILEPRRRFRRIRNAVIVFPLKALADRIFH